MSQASMYSPAQSSHHSADFTRITSTLRHLLLALGFRTDELWVSPSIKLVEQAFIFLIRQVQSTPLSGSWPDEVKLFLTGLKCPITLQKSTMTSASSKSSWLQTARAMVWLANLEVKDFEIIRHIIEVPSVGLTRSLFRAGRLNSKGSNRSMVTPRTGNACMISDQRRSPISPASRDSSAEGGSSGLEFTITGVRRMQIEDSDRVLLQGLENIATNADLLEGSGKNALDDVEAMADEACRLWDMLIGVAFRGSYRDDGNWDQGHFEHCQTLILKVAKCYFEYVCLELEKERNQMFGKLEELTVRVEHFEGLREELARLTEKMDCMRRDVQEFRETLIPQAEKNLEAEAEKSRVESAEIEKLKQEVREFNVEEKRLTQIVKEQKISVEDVQRIRSEIQRFEDLRETTYKNKEVLVKQNFEITQAQQGALDSATTKLSNNLAFLASSAFASVCSEMKADKLLQEFLAAGESLGRRLSQSSDNGKVKSTFKNLMTAFKWETMSMICANGGDADMNNYISRCDTFVLKLLQIVESFTFCVREEESCLQKMEQNSKQKNQEVEFLDQEIEKSKTLIQSLNSDIKLQLKQREMDQTRFQGKCKDLQRSIMSIAADASERLEQKRVELQTLERFQQAEIEKRTADIEFIEQKIRERKSATDQARKYYFEELIPILDKRMGNCLVNCVRGVCAGETVSVDVDENYTQTLQQRSVATTSTSNTDVSRSLLCVVPSDPVADSDDDERWALTFGALVKAVDEERSLK